MSIELRIKLAHLGMEPALIRKHEVRIKKKLEYLKNKNTNIDVNSLIQQRQRLNHHRRWTVRNAARATHLAIGFLNERAYFSMERNTEVGKRDKHIVPEVVRMVNKYRIGTVDIVPYKVDDIMNWIYMP